MIVRETHVAVVADNQDPDQNFRVKVKCAGIMGSEDVVLNQWLPPKLPWGMVIVPDIGEQIEVEVPVKSDTDEVPGQAFVDAPDIRWTGARFQGPTAYEAMFKTNYGKRRGFVTPAGHILMFDDTKGQEKINLVWKSTGDDPPKYAMFSIDEDGSVVIANKKGTMIYLNAANGEMSMIDEHGNSISSNSKGIKLVDKSGGFVDLDGDNKLIQAQAGTVYVGGLTGTQPGVLADALLTIFRAHVHLGVMSGAAISGPPQEIPPGLFDVIKSAVLQLK